MANYDLVFDGEDDYIEIPDSADFSVATTGQLSVSARIRRGLLPSKTRAPASRRRAPPA